MENKDKLFVIGIDSGTFDIINPMMECGELPNFAKLRKEGCSGVLESTIPPVTPPAWVSFMTGKNPGKHGVFDFYASPYFGYERPILNANYIKARTIWSILSEMDKRVGVINVPITSPPEKVNGFIIPGLQFGINVDGEFTYPPDLFKKIIERFGEYQVVYGNLMGVYSHELDSYISQWEKIHNMREKVTLSLMDEYPWDFFMVVFYSIDAIQHRFWKFYDKTHPFYDPESSKRYASVIPDFYKKIDSSIGKILEKLDDSTKVMVVSDHGMGPECKAFYLNRWLIKEGLLTLRKGFYPFQWVKFPHLVFKALKKLGYKGIDWTIPMSSYKVLKNKIDPREGLRISYFIDWSKTRAYAANYTEQGLYINLKGREPGGVVSPGYEYERLRDSIIGKLHDIIDPATGQKLFEKIYKKEEVYDGPYINHAPDLFFVMQGGSCLSHKAVHYKKLFRTDDRSSGTHRMNGIFMLKGKGIKENIRLDGCKIIDAAPTILYSMGLPILEDMDGRVIVSAFEKEYLKRNPMKFVSPTALNGDRGDGIMNQDESDMIRNSLRDLGYF